MVGRGALVTDAEVFFYELNYKVLTVFMLMLYPLVMVMSLAARTGSIFRLFRLDPFGSDEDVVEQPLVALQRTCMSFLGIVLLHMYMACHHLRDPIRLKRPHAWFAPVVLLSVSTTYFAHYATLPSTIGVHPAEKVAAAAASLILSVFTTILVLWE
ncbi:hypothetical protein C2845_PM04G28490 [Panicum miliaceum]|uniref:Uncharacterized protein n=1 Tax=Panicum miliaceum TaxID=4540 RepID=A0A3L6QX58_PANMI|nr:hypothetical protein C2845_PM04G28490 [Panicum miliaceum]